MSKIGSSNLGSLKSAYMKAKSENNTAEMSKLKQQAMKIMAEEKKSEDVDKSKKHMSNSKIIKNTDGDLIELSTDKAKIDI